MVQRQSAGELAAEQVAGLAEAEGLVSRFFWASFLGQVVLKGAKSCSTLACSRLLDALALDVGTVIC